MVASGTDVLFQPLKLGDITVRNRLAMAPCTRQRAHLDGTPTELMAEYYRQRAGAGLLITEGIAPCAMGMGYLFSPGLFTDAHEAGWRMIADAVHGRDGRIFGQIMHVGRLSDPLLLPRGSVPKGPSAVQPDPTARHYTIHCPRPKRHYPQPAAMTVDDIKRTVDDYAACAVRARRAGLDGVEVHGASGYLPMQFLSTNTNLRDDDYGGPVENRARFLLDVVEAMQAATSPGFVAVKVGPGWTFHNVFDDDPAATYSYVASALSKRRIAFLEVGNYGQDWDVFGTLRSCSDGPLIGVAGFTRPRAIEQIAAGRMDMVAFGQAYMANPDLAERFRNGWGLNDVRVDFYYTQGEEGYADYPAFTPDHADLLSVDSQISQVLTLSNR
ncbi:MAG TPA: alkene reductase [Rhizomicrobium sp.]|nr:alkene reductase [Rhizomicrobium sp.]